MVLRSDRDELESEATQIEDLAEHFRSDLQTRASAVEGMGWEGATRNGFINMFTEAKLQFDDVAEQITGIASALRGAAKALDEADQGIAQGM